MTKKILLFMILSLLATFSISKELMVNGQVIIVGPISANGSGCPNGSVTAIATGDNGNIAILFSAYSAITNADNPVAISDCNVAIPVSVRPGFTVGIVDVDWRGTVFSAPDSFVNFHREFFFSGREGPISDTNWESDGFLNFLLNDRPIFVSNSGCDGEALIARADTAATVIGAGSLFSLRAADIGAQLLLTVKVDPC